MNKKGSKLLKIFLCIMGGMMLLGIIVSFFDSGESTEASNNTNNTVVSHSENKEPETIIEDTEEEIIIIDEKDYSKIKEKIDTACEEYDIKQMTKLFKKVPNDVKEYYYDAVNKTVVKELALDQYEVLNIRSSDDIVNILTKYEYLDKLLANIPAEYESVKAYNIIKSLYTYYTDLDRYYELSNSIDGIISVSDEMVEAPYIKSRIHNTTEGGFIDAYLAEIDTINGFEEIVIYTSSIVQEGYLDSNSYLREKGVRAFENIYTGFKQSYDAYDLLTSDEVIEYENNLNEYQRIYNKLSSTYFNEINKYCKYLNTYMANNTPDTDPSKFEGNFNTVPTDDYLATYSFTTLPDNEFYYEGNYYHGDYHIYGNYAVFSLFVQDNYYAQAEDNFVIELRDDGSYYIYMRDYEHTIDHVA